MDAQSFTITAAVIALFSAAKTKGLMNKFFAFLCVFISMMTGYFIGWLPIIIFAVAYLAVKTYPPILFNNMQFVAKNYFISLLTILYGQGFWGLIALVYIGNFSAIYDPIILLLLTLWLSKRLSTASFIFVIFYQAMEMLGNLYNFLSPYDFQHGYQQFGFNMPLNQIQFYSLFWVALRITAIALSALLFIQIKRGKIAHEKQLIS
jgi:hypothetical protein